MRQSLPSNMNVTPSMMKVPPIGLPKLAYRALSFLVEVPSASSATCWRSIVAIRLATMLGRSASESESEEEADVEGNEEYAEAVALGLLPESGRVYVDEDRRKSWVMAGGHLSTSSVSLIKLRNLPTPILARDSEVRVHARNWK